jgi:hypothetical protein
VLQSPGFHLIGNGAADVTTAGDRSLEVIVVDNASADGSVEMVQADFPGVRVIANDENRGFTVGNNQGIAASRGRLLLLLNPDAELVDDAVTAMAQYLESHPDVALVGPRLTHADGSAQSSRRRFPTLATAFVESTVLQGLFSHSLLLKRYYMEDLADDVTQEVDWVVGAAMMVRREVVDQVGGLDEGYFMYSEELDWCRRIKGAKSPGGSPWRVAYVPQAQVIHHEGKSSEQALAVRHIQFHASKVRYFRKYHGRWASEILRAFLLCTYLWQMLEESVKWLLGHKRALRAGRISVYWQVVCSGLRTGRGPAATGPSTPVR